MENPSTTTPWSIIPYSALSYIKKDPTTGEFHCDEHPDIRLQYEGNLKIHLKAEGPGHLINLDGSDYDES
jgi:hypothetical protein